MHSCTLFVVAFIDEVFIGGVNLITYTPVSGNIWKSTRVSKACMDSDSIYIGR